MSSLSAPRALVAGVHPVAIAVVLAAGTVTMVLAAPSSALPLWLAMATAAGFSISGSV